MTEEQIANFRNKAMGKLSILSILKTQNRGLFVRLGGYCGNSTTV
ncbi:MAG: hypothetical protein DDT22_01372 [candidate division WS2 bacterium]|nr:hypothetical protein [Candidatus Lithacetigena glycinireducens]